MGWQIGELNRLSARALNGLHRCHVVLSFHRNSLMGNIVDGIIPNWSSAIRTDD
jgi:hypothetical protein